MRPMHLIRRVLVAGLFIAAGLALAAPLALYWLGLYAAGGRPEEPAAIALRDMQLIAWKSARGTGEPSVDPLNPYTYLWVAGSPGPRKAGTLVAWRVASRHIQKHRRYQGMGWWHLSGAALTIWLTRNWSVEQLLTRASEE